MRNRQPHASKTKRFTILRRWYTIVCCDGAISHLVSIASCQKLPRLQQWFYRRCRLYALFPLNRPERWSVDNFREDNLLYICGLSEFPRPLSWLQDQGSENCSSTRRKAAYCSIPTCTSHGPRLHRHWQAFSWVPLSGGVALRQDACAILVATSSNAVS